jgi:hypothetical protein
MCLEGGIGFIKDRGYEAHFRNVAAANAPNPAPARTYVVSRVNKRPD